MKFVQSGGYGSQCRHTGSALVIQYHLTVGLNLVLTLQTQRKLRNLNKVEKGVAVGFN